MKLIKLNAIDSCRVGKVAEHPPYAAVVVQHNEFLRDIESKGFRQKLHKREWREELLEVCCPSPVHIW